MNLPSSLIALVLGVIAFSQTSMSYAEIFKFQDKQGKWHFSDKKPKSADSSSLEEIHYQSNQVAKTSPFLDIELKDKQRNYIANNPLLAPIQAFLFDTKHNQILANKVMDPSSSLTLYTENIKIQNQDTYFTYVIGKPISNVPEALILPPFTGYKPMRVSQAFHGKFSHHTQPSLYAIDIGMPIGTKITAVKEGLVLSSKDDYPIAGVSSPFFLDKANIVTILHDDGTYAVYAHLLLGGVKVKVGQRVNAGEVIALSGNTGYSTGPHLHFVMRYNHQGKPKSFPFKFIQANNTQVKPKRGLWLMPVSAK